MKTRTIYLGFALVLLSTISLNSCKEEFFEAKNQDGSLDDFRAFTKAADFNAALTGCYVNLQGSGAAGELWVKVPGFVSQDVIDKDLNRANLNDFMSPNNTSNFQIYWEEAYKSVAATNLLLDKLAVIQPGLLTDAEIKLYTAQAKFIRGFAYFVISRAFGDVPMPLSQYNSSQNSLPCTPRNQVFAQVIKDLKEAALDLPEAGDYTPNNRGRVSKGAALAFLANAYMYVRDWPNAKLASEQLLGLNKPKYKLADNPHAAFSVLSKNDVAYLEENIFEVQYRRGKDWVIYGTGGSQANFNGSFLAAFTIPRNIGNTWDHYSGWGEYVVSKKALDSYNPTDLRRQTMTIGWGDTYEGEYFPRPITLADWRASSNVQFTAGFSTKYWLGNYASGLDLYPQGLPQMRFAEVLLNYAEILYMSNQKPEAYVQLNKVRSRALLTDLPVNTNEAIFMQSLMDERRHELMMEPNLWFHYTRTGTAAKFLLDNYSISMKPEWNFFPIPARERTLNPNLCANGY